MGQSGRDSHSNAVAIGTKQAIETDFKQVYGIVRGLFMEAGSKVYAH